MIDDIEDKFIGTLVGLAVGDALGAPFEFMHYKRLLKLKNEEIFKTAAEDGLLRYTDDTLMAIALARAIVDAKKFDPSAVAEEYYKWYLSGDLRGIGITVNRALANYGKTRNWKECGILDKFAAGNGTAMRVAPLALYNYKASLRKLYEEVRYDSIITHYNEEAITGAFVVALAIKQILEGARKEDILDKLIGTLESFGIKNAVFDKLNVVSDLLLSGVSFGEEVIEKIGNSGYVAESVPLAIYLFLESDNFEDTVYKAVKSGRDADTHAAIAGSIAGCYYGFNVIPKKYVDILEERDYLIILAKSIYELSHLP